MIKIDLEHNLSSLKIPELRVDPNSTIIALKQNIEKRYGSQPPYVRLSLKNKKGDMITQMQQDMRTLNFYGIQNGMIVSITDLNPNSIHKQIENTNQIQKYSMTEESYNALSENFRKWKSSFLLQNPQAILSASGNQQIYNPNYLKSLALTMQIGQRCQLQNGSRGQIRYIGAANELGFGYFIGIQLDQPIEGQNTISDELCYFVCQQGKAIYERPNKVETGDFPKIQENDQI